MSLLVSLYQYVHWYDAFFMYIKAYIPYTTYIESILLKYQHVLSNLICIVSAIGQIDSAVKRIALMKWSLSGQICVAPDDCSQGVRQGDVQMR